MAQPQQRERSALQAWNGLGMGSQSRLCASPKVRGATLLGQPSCIPSFRLTLSVSFLEAQPDLEPKPAGAGEGLEAQLCRPGAKHLQTRRGPHLQDWASQGARAGFSQGAGAATLSLALPKGQGG